MVCKGLASRSKRVEVLLQSSKAETQVKSYCTQHMAISTIEIQYLVIIKVVMKGLIISLVVWQLFSCLRQIRISRHHVLANSIL